jgi:hypothetical protein
MTLPSEYNFGESVEEQLRQLKDMYLRLRESVEGYTQEFEGVVFGSSTAGTCTYSVNNCYYVRRGIVIDVFYGVAWSGHTGTGNLHLKLPFFEKPFASSPSISAVIAGNITFPASTVYLVARSISNQDYVRIDAVRSAANPTIVSLPASGNIYFHHNYIGQVKK